MKLLFATHNPNKVKEFKKILKGIAKVDHLDEEPVEIQADTPEEVALDAAKRLAEKHKKTVIKEDSGLFIDALNGFPGVYSAPIHKQIGLMGILNLMDGAANRSCSYKSAVAMCAPGKKPIVFLGEERGTISTEVRGTKGFGHDPIFIPEGKEKTYGELGSDGKLFRRRALEKLINHLNESEKKR